MKRHNYTEEEKAFTCDNIKGLSYEELRQLFNVHFGIELTKGQISGYIKRYGLMNGCDCRFQKGQVSPNKGKKGISYAGMKKTQFKKGHIPHNHKPVGSERVTVDGYIEVKVAEPKNWRQKQVLVWENANGKVPKGHVVIILDGDKQNTELENLQLASRGELLIAQVYLAQGKRKK